MVLKNLSAAKGNSRGEINLQWDSVENAVSYIIEIANSNYAKDNKWKVLDIISDSRYTVRNLRSSKKYYFRIVLMSSDGKGKISHKIFKTAP